MNNRACGAIRFVNRSVSQRFRRWNRGSFVSEPVSLKVVSQHFRAVGERQLRQGSSRRAGDVKIVSHAVSHTQVAKADAVRPHADQLQLKKFAPALVQLGQLIEWRDLLTCASIFELYVFAHGFLFSAKGAQLNLQPGASPQESWKVQTAALKARFIVGLKVSRAFSACVCGNQFPGAMPQAESDMAPLALTQSGHGACSGKREKILVSFASQIPRSVISPVTRCRGVTSKPKLAAALRSGAICTSRCRPPSQPSARFISSASRCSIGICFTPSRIFQSMDDE